MRWIEARTFRMERLSIEWLVQQLRAYATATSPVILRIAAEKRAAPLERDQGANQGLYRAPAENVLF